MFQTQDLPDSGFKPIRFTINLVPHAQMRSRSRAMPLKNRATGQQIFDKRGKPMFTAMNHKAPEQAKNEEMMMQVLEKYAPEIPFDCPLILGVKVFLPIPATKPSWWRDAAITGFIRPTGRPDFDNFFKQCADVMTQTSYWRDDSLIVGMTGDSGKYYAEKPHWDISVAPLWQPQSKKDWELFLKQQKAQEPVSVTITTAQYDTSDKYVAMPIQKDLFS